MQPVIHAALAEDQTLDFEGSIPTHRLAARRPCRVLVVDDDYLVRARLSALLKALNYDIEVAASGEEAIGIMSVSHFHIVLTDWQMPDMDGLALCRYLRINQEDGYTYILMLTVRDTKEDRLTGFAAGADDYIVKGGPIDEILARLEVGRRITCMEQPLRTINRHMLQLPLTDPLTGAYNLRYFVKHLSRELSRSRRYGRPLAVLTCEIEEFTQINDRCGCEATEELLRTFVMRAESRIRTDSDWLARVGDAEFMVVLPETAADGANRVAQKLHQILALEPVPTRAGPVSVTASIGVTAVEAKHELDGPSRIENLVRAAERRLYANRQIDAHLSAAVEGGSGIN